jgi:glucokinase
MLLAGDIGGTSTRLGLFTRAPRPRPAAVRIFSTLEYRDLPTMIAEFLEGERVNRSEVEAITIGVAGPVIEQAAELTNVPWRVDARQVHAAFGVPRVALLNDLQAMAESVPLLEPAELHTLQAGRRVENGNMALIAAGTGLGEALLHHVRGAYVPSPTEAGHADFAARSEREIGLLRYLISRYGRAEVEHVVSGRGLLNVFAVTHVRPCAAAIDPADVDAPALITNAGLDRRCDQCVEALEMFVDAYGAEAGNHALRSVATAGVYIGGGIAPKILPALTDGRFLRAFRAKAPFEQMLSDVPVHVILNAESGLLGAAVFAATLV